jgi:long-chain acyl-CoA synthetase
VAPEKLENIFVKSPYVAQNFIYGDSFKNYVVGIFVIEPSEAKKFAENHGLDSHEL